MLEVSYESVTGKKYKEKTVIDMSERKGMYQLGKSNLYSIAQSLEKTQQDISRIASGFNRIKADIYTHKDRLRE